MLHQPGVDRLAQVGGEQPTIFLLDVVARLDDLDGWRKGARPADAELFQRLDQGRLRVARRRLGEVLLGLELLEIERFVDREHRQLLLLVVVAVAFPDAVEAVEDQHRAVRPEQVVGGGDIDARLSEAGGGHLARGEALPDQPIDLELVRRQKRSDGIRGALDIGRTDRLMGILDRALGLELDLVAARIGRTVLLGDEPSRLGARVIGDPEGVGAHVGDQADRTLVAELDALVELLRQAHRAIRLQP